MLFKGKKVLIIGGTGSIGKKIVDDLLEKEVGVIRILSRDEYKQFIMQNEYKEHSNIRFLLGDVRDKERVNRAMRGVDIVFHLAAIKHVPAAEYNPFEAVKTNVMGTQNVINCAILNNVERVVYTSSDKAVAPTNTMGATKLLSERLIASADFFNGQSEAVFTAVRFGNVMGSRGSVIPLWEKQILNNRELTITEMDMTRFMMTLNQAAYLTIKACEQARGGEVFVLKMPVIRLGEFAEVILEEVCKKYSINKNEVTIKKIGLRPGEKMYEELMTLKETEEAVEFNDMFAILPTHKLNQINFNIYKRPKYEAYSSQHSTVLNKEQIRKYIIENKLI